MADAERKQNPQKGDSNGSLFDRDEELGGENNNFYHSENLINIDLESIPRSLEKSHERIEPKVLGCSSMHYDITLNIVKPDKGIARISDYNEVKAKYRSIINMYRSRISEYLQVEDDIVESKCLVGTSIDSSRLADKNKRYWKKVKRGDTLPDLAFMFMIDCSYSMEGFRMKAANDYSCQSGTAFL